MKRAIATIAVGLAATLMASAASAQATLNNVKQKGFLTCGSNTGLAGFGVNTINRNRLARSDTILLSTCF